MNTNPSTPTAPPILLTLAQAAEVLQLGERTVWGLGASGEIPTVRIGRAVRYPYRGLEEWVARKAIECPATTHLDDRASA
jgi:excisionase family DNA binding protein